MKEDMKTMWGLGLFAVGIGVLVFLLAIAAYWFT